MKPNGGETMEEKKATFIEHLEELRKVLIICIIAILIGTIASYTFLREWIGYFVFEPINRLDKELVMIGVTEGLFTQLKISFLGGFILSSPVIFWQFLRFILPALYKNEKKLLWISLILGVALFVTGIAFGYLCVLDIGLAFLLNIFAEGLTPMISVSKYVSFFMSFLLPFGLIFQIPLVSMILTITGIITPVYLRKQRSYVILGVFILAALLTPSDVVTQIFMALPMLILYELSIMISMLIYRRKKKKNI